MPRSTALKTDPAILSYSYLLLKILKIELLSVFHVIQ